MKKLLFVLFSLVAVQVALGMPFATNFIAQPQAASLQVKIPSPKSTIKS